MGFSCVTVQLRRASYYTNLSSKMASPYNAAHQTMESSISHCFNITGWRKYTHQQIKFSTVVKLLCISIHTPNLSFLS